MLSTHDYIRCAENAIWQWDSSGEYIRVRNGSVFAHWNEVQAMLVQIAPMGLPVFDVLLAVTAATAAYQNESLIDDLKAQLLPNRTIEERKDRLRILDCIHALDRQYRTGDNRFALIATILEKANRKIIEANSNKIALELQRNPQYYKGTIGPSASRRVAKVLSSLEAFSHHFDSPEALLEAMLGFDRTRIKLEALIPELGAPDKEYDSVLDELLDNPNTHKMAALIPYIDSGIKIPLHSKRNDNRPEGGVSDLSNKGHFDQLIISEFAYDDTYFLSRIVNNEALFYQKEPARKDDKNELCVIVDSSLYMWGMSKLLASAITCALAIKENETDVVAYCVGEFFEVHDFASLPGILQATRFTSSSICPAEGLNQLMSSDFDHTNVLFITTENSWKRPEMSVFNGAHSNWYDHVLFVNEDAEIQLRKAKGKQLASIKLDPETIWSMRQKNAITPKVETPSTYPILCPISSEQIRFSLGFENQIFFVNKSKGLFRFTPNRDEVWKTKGAEYLTVVESNITEQGDIGYNEKGELEVLLVNRRDCKVWIYNLHTRANYYFDFELLKSGSVRLFYHQNHEFVFIVSNYAFVLDKKYDGTYSSQQEVSPSLLRAARSRSRSINVTFPTYESYLINAKAAFITDANELIINSHKIEVFNSKIQFVNPPKGNTLVAARRDRVKAGFHFSFRSGESILVTRHGVLEFTFAPGKAPTGYELYLEQVGPSKIATVKALNEHLPGLKASKELVDKGKGLIGVFSSESDAKVYQDWMNSMNNTISMKKVPLGEKFYLTASPNFDLAAASERYFTGNERYRPEKSQFDQAQIEIVRFYDLYLKSFISNIKNGI